MALASASREPPRSPLMTSISKRYQLGQGRRGHPMPAHTPPAQPGCQLYHGAHAPVSLPRYLTYPLGQTVPTCLPWSLLSPPGLQAQAGAQSGQAP